METYKFLLDLCLILLSTKVLGLLTRKFSMPQVVGALLAGVILGPGILGIITPTDFISDTAEVGVIVLMFCAGMETDVQELKEWKIRTDHRTDRCTGSAGWRLCRSSIF